jgi:mRNA-degrading endonuclease RelE of RelBE toxin-antitoxin system
MLTKNISDMIYSVKLSKPAEESLAYILHQNKEIGRKILGQLKHRLPYDPYPDIDDEQDLFHSEIVKSLEEEDVEVQRLKSREFSGYRVFYIVDEDEYLIYVLEIVQRSLKTYDITTPHMQRIKDLYIRYYISKK